ncbi:hypothetical protein SeMB42_g02510 [Synchytrium endobioticum]|uniref:Uncharacterized protein n=1 Tax=Synchytrium endobioticum TaxID=286115 RepID=A0A507DDW4_9FUNG|nr:hypothetical protein SeMB42_g02510 [Synchytrium endobioticum]
MHPGPHDLAPLNDEIDGCNLLRRFNDPDRPTWGSLIMQTSLLLASAAITVVSFDAMIHPLLSSRNILFGAVGCVPLATTVVFGYALWISARKFFSANRRVELEIAGIGPAPVPIEAPDLENQLPQVNDGQIPVHINDEAHHAGTAGTHIARLLV